ncbi:hypothetical protein Lal_00001660 [Lupinus albus]|nr:hypothetical protein Lal_00001660 [Lupinus albus]
MTERPVISARPSTKEWIKPFTFVFVRQILFSSIQARFCLNLRGRRRSGSPATTSVDPTKSLNLAAARSLISDSPATRSMNNLSKIFFLISDSPATRSRDPTFFSNLVARLIGTPVGSSCIQIMAVPGPASTKNISSPKRKTSDCSPPVLTARGLSRALCLLPVPKKPIATWFRIKDCHLLDNIHLDFEAVLGVNMGQATTGRISASPGATGLAGGTGIPFPLAADSRSPCLNLLT